MNQKVERLSLWWGEATDEPAREDARPTNRFMAAMRVQYWKSKHFQCTALSPGAPVLLLVLRPSSSSSNPSRRQKDRARGRGTKDEEELA